MKGIQCITAVTGREAQSVTRVAQSLEAKLDQLMETTENEKDVGLKALSVV